MKEGNQKGKEKSKKGSSIRKDMNQILSDPRFAHVSTDLKLRHVPKEERKIKLDSRFHSVLTDDKFYEKSIMDPRGRKGSYSTKEDLLKFYQISSGEDTDEEEEQSVSNEDEDSNDEVDGKSNEVGETLDRKDNIEVHAERKESKPLLDKDNKDEEEEEKGKRLMKEKVKEKEKLEISEEVLEQLQDMTRDYARGEMLFSDDSSDDDSSTTDEDEDVGEFEWGELDQDALWDDGEHEVEETSRIAVCNLDWDRIKAADIMVLFTSFCPRGASVKRVTIYPSEYGKQRMEEENISGPQELKTKSGHSADDDIDLVDLDKLEKGMLDENAGATKANYEALRRYQRNRLRYYYAVVECDSVNTAKILYQECDRQPYEGAGILLDLRYIPSDMNFEETPHDVCETVQKSYEVKSFTTTALHDSRPVLTWDETDPERRKILSVAMSKAMKGEELDEDYLKGFLASSSEDDSSVEEEDESNSDDEDTKASQIAKFRALISEIDDKESKKVEKAIDMEESFSIEEDINEEPKQTNRESTIETTQLKPFERYLEKRKAKRKNREKNKKGLNDMNSNDSEQENESSVTISDDELPEDIGDLYSDPFFAKELKVVKKNKNQKKGETKKVSSEDKGTEDNMQGNLELLLMNEDDEDKKHFSMRDIIEKNKEKKRRRKNKTQKKRQEKQEQNIIADDFKVDATDPRFSQLLTSGEYNIDPSHPQFKRTKAMDHLIDFVQTKRIAESFEDIPDAKRQNKSVEKSKDHELSQLVMKVKKKTKFQKVH